jgi:SAM-dependent methyltransferase
MSEHPASRYGDAWHDVYDAWHPLDGGAVSTVRELQRLAGQGRVLELGIGTGRIAIPLARRGVRVEGVEASERMLALLRAKPGAEDIPVTVGNMRDVPVPGPFDVVFVVANTLFCLLTQDDQVRCFENVSRCLADGGHFVVECFVPGRDHPAEGSRVMPWALGEETRIHIAEADPVAQRIRASTVSLVEGNAVRMVPVELRYAWPPELDLMARLAGMELRWRWGNWDKAPFTGASRQHVSVYRKPATGAE